MSRKLKQERQIPFLQNIEYEEYVDYSGEKKRVTYKAFGMNTMDPIECFPVHVFMISEKQKGTMITSIRCPYCGKAMYYDDHWMAFICNKHEPRKIIELCLKNLKPRNVVLVPSS